MAIWDTKAGKKCAKSERQGASRRWRSEQAASAQGRSPRNPPAASALPHTTHDLSLDKALANWTDLFGPCGARKPEYPPSLPPNFRKQYLPDGFPAPTPTLHHPWPTLRFLAGGPRVLGPPYDFFTATPAGRRRGGSQLPIQIKILAAETSRPSRLGTAHHHQAKPRSRPTSGARRARPKAKAGCGRSK